MPGPAAPLWLQRLPLALAALGAAYLTAYLFAPWLTERYWAPWQEKLAYTLLVQVRQNGLIAAAALNALILQAAAAVWAARDAERRGLGGWALLPGLGVLALGAPALLAWLALRPSAPDAILAAGENDAPTRSGLL